MCGLESLPIYYYLIAALGCVLWFAAQYIYNHAAQSQTLKLTVENKTGAQLEFAEHFMQYGTTTTRPDDPNIKHAGNNTWEFCKTTHSMGLFAMWYGINGLMRFTLGTESVIIAWNVPDPWGAWFPWFNKNHLNNFDVKLIANDKLKGKTIKDIAEEHDLDDNKKLWQMDAKWKQQFLGVCVHIDLGTGYLASAEMCPDWRKSTLHVKVIYKPGAKP